MINSHDKGKKGEIEWSNICKQHGYTTRRGQQFCGANGDADVIGIENLHIEVKRVEKLNISIAMQQAIRDKKEKEIPIVAHRKNREDWMITMLADDFFKLYKSFNSE